jgi:hypothetical protein
MGNGLPNRRFEQCVITREWLPHIHAVVEVDNLRNVTGSESTIERRRSPASAAPEPS